MIPAIPGAASGCSGRGPRSFHEGPSVDLHRRMLVVRAAEEPDPVDIVPVCARESVHVIEFQRSSLAAAPPPLVRERAAPFVAFVDRSFDRIRKVARAAGFLLRRPPALPAPCESPLLDVLDQEIECPFQDGRQFPVRYPMPEQILRLP